MDLTVRQVLDRYGPAAAVIIALVLLMTVVPGNVTTRRVDQTLYGGRGPGTSLGTSTTGNGPVAGEPAGTAAGAAKVTAGGSALNGGAGSAGSLGGAVVPGSQPTAGGGQPGVQTTFNRDGTTTVVSRGVTQVWGPATFPTPDKSTVCRADGTIVGYHEVEPPCVPLYLGANGGATDQGVTATTIKVVVYRPKSDQTQAALVATAAKEAGETEAQAREYIEAFRKYFNRHRETYHRQIVFTYFDGTGTDAQSVAADSIKIVETDKPFAVIGAASMPEVISRGVLCFCGSTPGLTTTRQFPGLGWGWTPTMDVTYANVAEYIGNELRNKPAAFAGAAPVGQPTFNNVRTFGLMYLESGSDHVPSPDAVNAAKNFKSDLASTYGVQLAVSIGYAADITQYQQQATNMVAQMLAAKVNVVVNGADAFMDIFFSSAAQNQNYNPEYLLTGFGGQDIVLLVRLNNQSQWAHAYGMGTIPPYETDPKTSTQFAMYKDGGGDPNDLGANFRTWLDSCQLFFDGIMYAGPVLTRRTFAQGLFTARKRGGYPGTYALVQPTVQSPAFWNDFVEEWWNPTATGPDEAGDQGAGLLERSQGGLRHGVGTWQSGKPHVFGDDPKPTPFKNGVLPAGPYNDQYSKPGRACRSC